MAQWRIDPRKWIDEAIGDATKAYGNFGRAALATVKQMTPRDTGLLEHGWFLTLDAPSDARPVSPDDPFDDGLALLGTVKLRQRIIIQDNVEYGRYVNDGTERMAGRFFVEGAIASLQG